MKGLTATMGMMTYGERLMGAGRGGSSTSDAWKGRLCYLHSGRAHASGAITLEVVGLFPTRRWLFNFFSLFLVAFVLISSVLNQVP